MSKTTKPNLSEIEPVAVAEGDYPYNCTWLGEVRAGDKLYSAATVEQLVQERGDCRALVQSLYEVLGQKKDQLAAMTKKADGFFDALQLAAKINAEGQAREKQLREALEICKKEMQGDKWDALYIDGVLANK